MGLEGQIPARLILYFIANLMLVALGLYLLGLTRALAFTERAGQKLWRHLQPLTRRFLPARTVAQAFPLGLLWGWLPCGLVYSALASALTAGSASRGGLMMLAFGLGTLPNLLLAGMVLARLNEFVRRPVVRTVSGLLVLGFGLYGFVGLMRLSGWL
jgi:sulfite exporter TauE/SafE